MAVGFEEKSASWLATAALAAFVLILVAGHASGQTPQTVRPPADLKKLSLDALQEIEVTSVSKRSEKLSGAPSSIQVVTGDDIRRAGATSLPEALRLASNLQVAQVDSHGWAISARGFNNTSANKLLVLVDGRAVYTPLHAGVFWDAQDTLLEDIERIEIISGPGATLWGANAVNGVINIITKTAKDSQGGLVTAAGGSELRDTGGVRYGGNLGASGQFRVYGKYFGRDSSALPVGRQATDDLHMGQGGFCGPPRQRLLFESNGHDPLLHRRVESSRPTFRGADDRPDSPITSSNSSPNADSFDDGIPMTCDLLGLFIGYASRGDSRRRQWTS